MRNVALTQVDSPSTIVIPGCALAGGSLWGDRSQDSQLCNFIKLEVQDDLGHIHSLNKYLHGEATFDGIVFKCEKPTCGPDVLSAFHSNRIPIPLKQLDNNVCARRRKSR